MHVPSAEALCQDHAAVSKVKPPCLNSLFRYTDYNRVVPRLTQFTSLISDPVPSTGDISSIHRDRA
jgi:hypothetical protein